MQILMLEPCQVNFGGDKGGQHVEANTVQDVDADTARTLCVTCSRAAYLDKKDDPTKGTRSATPEQIAASGKPAKAKASA